MGTVSDVRVSTYESGPPGLRLLGRHASLAASSSDLPEGAYTTLRTYGGRGVVRLDQHLRRLEESVALQGRSGSIDPAGARRAIGSALDEAGHAESRLRLTFAPPRLFVAIELFAPLPKRSYEDGVACLTLDVRRENPHAKDTRFIATAQSAYGRLPAGVEEGLIASDDGAILEGLSSNFFAVVGGALRTEEVRALAGVTRSLVLEVAGGLMPVERRALRLDERPRADEAFVTSVSREVLPVVRIDGRPVGDGRVGVKVRRIMAAFAELVKREVEPL
jgi:branched-chain amino acid aminotransferase